MRRKWQLTPVLLPGESHRQRSLVGYSPRGRKESGKTERLTLWAWSSLCFVFQIPHVSESMQHLFFSVWLISISIMPSRSICVVTNSKISRFLWLRGGFPGKAVVKNPRANGRDASLSPGWERSPGGGNGNTLQYSCLEDSMDERSLVGYSPWGHRVSMTVTKHMEHNIPYCPSMDTRYFHILAIVNDA